MGIDLLGDQQEESSKIEEVMKAVEEKNAMSDIQSEDESEIDEESDQDDDESESDDHWGIMFCSPTLFGSAPAASRASTRSA